MTTTMQTGTISKVFDVTPNIADRRRHSRHRLSAPITLSLANGITIQGSNIQGSNNQGPTNQGPMIQGPSIQGMTIEISESGLSAAINAPLVVGDHVFIQPVGGSDVQAIVRRITGRIYGFQFLNLNVEQTQRLREQCRWLPRYTSVFDFRPSC
jgi:hypothetical protein